MFVLSEQRPFHLLIVDDDQRLRVLLVRYLKAEGFNVSTAASVAEAIQAVRLFKLDLIILDVMMPREKGTLLFATQNIALPPVLLLTAMGEADDRVYGLKLGAEDYVVKPFDPRELLLRIQKILKRSTGDTQSYPQRLYFGDVFFDLNCEYLIKKGQPVLLTSSELSLLKIFIQHLGQLVTREFLSQLTGAVGNVRTIDVQVGRLRQKIEENPGAPRFLQTVRGEGYVLRAVL